MSKIGTVVGLTGKAWVRGMDGSLRELSPGDQVTDAQALVLAAGATIEVSYGSGGADEVVRYAADDSELTIVPPQQTAAPEGPPQFERMVDDELGSDSPDETDASGSDGTVYGHRFVELVRIEEALEAGAAPPVVLAATHISALEFVNLHDLKAYADDPVR